MRNSMGEIIVKVPFSALIDLTDHNSSSKTTFKTADGKIYKLLNGKFVQEEDIESFGFRQHSDDNYDDYFEISPDISGELPEDSVPNSGYNSSNFCQLIGEADVAFSHKPTESEIKKMGNKIGRVISACITLYGRDCFSKDRDIPEEILQDDFDHTKFKNRKARYVEESEYFVKRFIDNYLPEIRNIYPEFIAEKSFVEVGDSKNGEFKINRAYGGADSFRFGLPKFYINDDAEEAYHRWMRILKDCFYSEFGDKQNVRELKKKNTVSIDSECVVDNITGSEQAGENGGCDYVSGERLTVVYTANVSAIKQSYDGPDGPSYEIVTIDPKFINDAIKAGVTLYGKSFLNKNESEQREGFINSYISSYNKNDSLFVEDTLLPPRSETYHIDVRSLDIKKVLSTEFVQKVLPNSVGETYANATPESPVPENYIESSFGSADTYFERNYGSTAEMKETEKFNFLKIQFGDE